MKIQPLFSLPNAALAAKNKGNAKPHKNGGTTRQPRQTPVFQTATPTIIIKTWLNG
jgi:hypothetical protein